jgi:hypothetical protein
LHPQQAQSPKLVKEVFHSHVRRSTAALSCLETIRSVKFILDDRLLALGYRPIILNRRSLAKEESWQSALLANTPFAPMKSPFARRKYRPLSRLLRNKRQHCGTKVAVDHHVISAERTGKKNGRLVCGVRCFFTWGGRLCRGIHQCRLAASMVHREARKPLCRAERNAIRVRVCRSNADANWDLDLMAKRRHTETAATRQYRSPWTSSSIGRGLID